MIRKILLCFVILLALAAAVSACQPNISHIKTKFLSGRVTDTDGRIFPDQPVVIFKDGGSKEIIAETRSDDKGVFRFDNVPPGKYWLEAGEYERAFSVLKVLNTSKKVPNSEIVVVIAQCSGWVEVKKLVRK